MLERPRILRSFLLATTLVIVVSIVAYAGGIPRFVSAHGVDKALHAAMGFALTFLLARAWRGRAALAGALVLVPLALDEYLQRFSTHRTSDWNDLIADVVGIAFAIVLTAARARSTAPARLVS